MVPTQIQTTVCPSVGTNGNLESTDTIQIEMGALVNQSHAKKLFGARLIKNYAKSNSELGNIFQYDSNKNELLRNFSQI